MKKTHLADFVYLVNPDGYLRRSAAFEIGHAFVHNFKVFSYSEIQRCIDILLINLVH